MYSVLTSAINHPDTLKPYRGLFNHRIIKSLATSGLSVEAVSPRPFAPPVGPYSSYTSIPEVKDCGPYTVHYPRFWYLVPKRLFYGLSGESYARRIPRYVERTFETPDVVHACHIFPDGYGMLPYVRKHDVPLFVVAHGALLNEFGEHPPGVDARIRETLAVASGVLCVSDALAAKARTLTDPSKVTTVPIGADPDEFPVDRRARIRRELGIAPETTVVLFVGAFSKRKGIHEIVELLSDLDVSETTFAFIGYGGPLETDLRRGVAESEYSDRHIYTGVTSETLREWFAIADLLLLPSHAEGRPTVIYEAMASETAVLASDVGGVGEQVVDGETGRLVPPGDVTALRDALESLTSDPALLRRFGRAGYERLVEREWTWDGHARRLREIHRAAIE
ncbi:glycosyltransferase family 4 protein [Natronomonas sp.]|uniref:glycosyltransferase family 4 protein n=1 Tax=Natronomonas sp. TaxID=2184060 RepID=UPI003975C483